MKKIINSILRWFLNLKPEKKYWVIESFHSKKGKTQRAFDNFEEAYQYQCFLSSSEKLVTQPKIFTINKSEWNKN